jgi:hypothetical protein
MYCSAERPIWGRQCGPATSGAVNRYYTHRRDVAPDEKGELAGSLDFRVAACRGRFDEYNWRGFHSDADGGYTCPTPYQLSRPAKPDITATAVAPTAAQACAQARSLFAPGDRVQRDCECKPLRQAGAAASEAGGYRCRTQGWLSEADAEAVRSDHGGRLMNWLKAQARCAAIGQGDDCLYRAEPEPPAPGASGAGTGVRG